MRSILEEHYKSTDTPRLYELSNLSFSITELTKRIVRAKFPEIEEAPPVYFGKMKRAAFCEVMPGRKPLIVINSVFNHATAPLEIIEAILIHELLHIIIRPRQIGDRLVAHPPELFEKERALSPNKGLTWAWLRLTFLSDLVVDKEKESTFIKNMRRHRKKTTFMSLAVLREILGEDLTEAGECL